MKGKTKSKTLREFGVGVLPRTAHIIGLHIQLVTKIDTSVFFI